MPPPGQVRGPETCDDPFRLGLGNLVAVQQDADLAGVQPGLGAFDAAHGGRVCVEGPGGRLQADTRTFPQYAQSCREDTVLDRGTGSGPHAPAFLMRAPKRSRTRTFCHLQSMHFAPESTYMPEIDTRSRLAPEDPSGRSAQSWWIPRLPEGVPEARHRVQEAMRDWESLTTVSKRPPWS